MFSVICVYSNKHILADCLEAGLQNQDVQHELILVDNTQGQFQSAAKALNSSAVNAKGKYLVFVHQDVKLLSSSWLRDAERMLDGIPDLGVAGVAGARGSQAARLEFVTNIRHGIEASSLPGVLPVERPEKVQTLDECLLIVPSSVFSRLRFDETVCNDWHLYGVDFCLSLAGLGLSAHVLPLPTYHRSKGLHNTNLLRIVLGIGALAPEYYASLGRVLKKHRDQVAVVYATTGRWDSRRSLLLQRLKGVGEVIVNGYLHTYWRGALRRVGIGGGGGQST
jgi:glycosyltransferase involved in cell wall biosynthesis